MVSMPLILQRLLPHPLRFGFLQRAQGPSHQPLHPGWVVFWISVWMSAVCNVPLWRELAHLPGHGSLRSWVFMLAFMVLVTAGNAALLSLLAWRWCCKTA